MICSHCADRVFSKKQWIALREKLGSWRDNMKHLLQMIESARQAQAQHLQEMGIEVIRDMPAVGSNLHDHFNTAVSWRCSKPMPPMRRSRPVMPVR